MRCCEYRIGRPLSTSTRRAIRASAGSSTITISRATARSNTAFMARAEGCRVGVSTTRSGVLPSGTYDTATWAEASSRCGAMARTAWSSEARRARAHISSSRGRPARTSMSIGMPSLGEPADGLAVREPADEAERSGEGRVVVGVVGHHGHQVDRRAGSGQQLDAEPLQVVHRAHRDDVVVAGAEALLVGDPGAEDPAPDAR